MSRDELCINRVPVDVVFVPILFFVFAKECGEHVHLRFEGDDEESVAFFQHRLGIGQNHFTFSPNARYHKFGVLRMMHHIVDVFAKECRIFHTIGSDERLFVVVGVFAFVVALQPSAHDHQDNDDAHHADGVGDGTTQGGYCRGLSQLFECLLCSTEGRSVGGGTTKHSHEIGKGQPTCHSNDYCHDSADDDDCQGEDVEPRASVFEGRHESRSHL